MEVALLSEFEFKHQVTTAGGGGGEGGGRRKRGGHESTEVQGCPEDRKRDGGRGREGRERCSGEQGMGGPIRAVVWVRRRRKRVKGQVGRESGRESGSASEIQNCNVFHQYRVKLPAPPLSNPFICLNLMWFLSHILVCCG